MAHGMLHVPSTLTTRKLLNLTGKPRDCRQRAYRRAPTLAWETKKKRKMNERESEKYWLENCCSMLIWCFDLSPHLIFGCSTSTCYPSGRPYRCRCIWTPQFHCDHTVLSSELHIAAIQCDFAQIQMASHTKWTHHIVDDNINFGLGLDFFCGVGNAVGINSHAVINAIAVRIGFVASGQCRCGCRRCGG